jgi:hypothetical protein
MLGTRRLIVDSRCEIAYELRPWTDEVFYDLAQHDLVSRAIYIIGRRQFSVHHELIKSAINSHHIRVVFSNPHEGSETLRWQLTAYGIQELVRLGKILVISGGDIEAGFAHYQHETFVSKCFGYRENISAQQHDVYTMNQKPYQYLFLNGRYRPHRKYLLQHLPLDQALWSNLDTSNGPLQILPTAYEVDRYRHRILAGTGFLKSQLFGAEWGDIYINPRAYTDTYFSVVTETVFDYPYSFRTEKIWKPIFMSHPWIAVANAGYYRDIRNLGFRTYSNLIDESFDRIDNNQDRLTRIKDVILDLLSQNLEKFLTAARDTSKYNQQHMLDVSQQVLDQFPQRFLEFINQNFNE